MKKKLFVVALSLSMMSSMLVGQALAGSTTISGTLSMSDPGQSNLALAVAATPPCVAYQFPFSGFNSPSGLWVFHYDLYAFKVTVDGSYSFADAGSATPPVMTLFGGPFTPGAPTTNCMNSWTGFSAPLVAGHTYYLQVWPDFYGCGSESLPCFGGYSVSISGPGNVILLPKQDDRINWDSSQGGPVALYCHGDNKDTLEAWIIDQGSGKGTFLFSWDNFSDPAPATNTLLFDAGTVQLWHLTSGEYEVHAVYSPQYGVWKGYAFIFNGCPYDGGGYTHNFDPGDNQ